MNRDEFLVSDAVGLQESPLLFYVSGYKYQSRCDMVYFAGVYPPVDIVTDLIALRRDGWMWVGCYFAWDGCSGPTIDTPTNMRAGHAHDALAALIRMGKLAPVTRFASNELIRRIMIADGAYRWRADLYRLALNHTASWADPKNAKRVLTAPHQMMMPDLSPA